LQIVAVDARSRALQPVPMSLELEEQHPPLFNLSNEIISSGGITPNRPGRFRFRARTICPGTSAEVFIPAVVSAS
jgi:hypothetical protein